MADFADQRTSFGVPHGSRPTISRHLKVLREAGLITGERRGTWVYYKAIGDKMSALARLLLTAEAPAPTA